MQGEDSGNYDEELSLYAKKIYLMFKTSSINWSAVSAKELIWIEAAFFIDGEISSKVKEAELNLTNDIRFLIKDIDDLKRLQLSNGKTSSVISWQDLPSMKGHKKAEESVEVRKAFLKNLSEAYKNK